MRGGFYFRIAANGFQKNRQLYLPYMISTALFVLVYYILIYLGAMDYPEGMRGARTLPGIMPLAGGIVALFSLLFLFYISTFLLRRRSKEFGLYSILGMSKRNLCRIIVHEYLITGIVSILAGLLAGILFSKLAELGLYHIMEQDIELNFRLPLKAVTRTVATYGGIFIILLLRALCFVKRNNPLALFGAGNKGEKKPKANWFLAVLGTIMLVVAYYLAVRIKNPLSAFLTYFFAVVMVIVATYLLFIAGSVALCRTLQKNKRYYYHRNHFVPVSAMTYRMKRNGAGLASICILSTVVLVVISNVVGLYAATGKSAYEQYPYDVCMGIELSYGEQCTKEEMEEAIRRLQQAADKYQASIRESREYLTAETYGMLQGNAVELDADTLMYSADVFDISDYNNICDVTVVGIEDYNELTGKLETLEENECLLYTVDTAYREDEISFVVGGEQVKSCHIKKQIDSFDVRAGSFGGSGLGIGTMFFVVPDVFSFWDAFYGRADFTGELLVPLVWNYDFDLNVPKQDMIRTAHAFQADIMQSVNGEHGVAMSFGCRQEEIETNLELNASLFYIGILISAVFFVATVLIIYYKQIAEGYEDEKNFEIMQRIGMKKEEIRQSIRVQMRMVFLLPVVFAGVHIAFSFRFTSQILKMLGIWDAGFVAIVTVICFLVFAVLYTVIYRITTQAYVKIVGGAGKLE